MKLRIVLPLLLTLLLTACGGGGGGGGEGSSQPTSTGSNIVVAPAVNAAPVGNAGADQNVSVGDTVTVDAGASHDANGDSLTYKWSLSKKPEASKAAITAAASVRPTFIADVAGIYVASLVVNDGKIDSIPVSATITASEKQVSMNAAPIANAGPNQIAAVGTTVSLNGGASFDANGDALGYRWTLVSKPLGSSAGILSNSVVKPQLSLDMLGTYSIALIVNDGKADSLPATVLITAVAPPSPANIAPIANAGLDQMATVGSTVVLDGTLSADPNGDKLTYAWSIASKPIGSSAQILAPWLVKPEFVVDVTGVYQLSLSVNDGKLASTNADTINVVVMSPSAIVIPDSGIYRCATLSKQSALLLYSQGHTYLDRDHDGRPCEANDIANEIASPYVAPTNPSSGQCYVNGYYRANGTYVKGYYRSCRS